MKAPISILLLALGAALSGCVSEQEVRKDVTEAAEPLRKAPEGPVQKTITNFTPALRCMDYTFMMYGIRDLVVITEDIDDKTKKVSAGTKDMLISSVSEMTKSSRAVRLIAYGNDSGNLISFMKEAESKSMFQLRPQFGIRGSISQLDENIAKKTTGGGFAWEPFGGVGKASTAAVSVLGLDLTMMSTEDLTIIPGVASNNSVAIMRSGTGTEAEAGYHKFGINYQMNLSRSDGMAQALRNLVNLAAIELFGKLTKTPYWACLGSDTNAADVKTEIEDWYHSLFADTGSFVAYWQNQLRLRGLYEHEVNGVPDDALRDAIVAYRGALGLEQNAKLDLAFFTAYLGANHYEVAPKAQALLAASQRPAAVPAMASASPSAPASAPASVSRADNARTQAPIQLGLSSGNGSNRFRPGESIFLNIQPSRDAYVYCFMQDESKAIMRFFPNRFIRDAFVPARGLRLPKGSEFNITASGRGSREHIACFATGRDVFTELPANVAAGDFEALQVGSLGELQSAFQRLQGTALGVADFPIQVR